MKCKWNLSRIESRVFFWQFSLFLHVEHQISTVDVLDDEKQARRAWEAGMKSDKERMIRGCFENMLFSLNPVDVFFVANELFFDDFHRVKTLCCVQTDQKNLKSKITENLALIIVIFLLRNGIWSSSGSSQAKKLTFVSLLFQPKAGIRSASPGPSRLDGFDSICVRKAHFEPELVLVVWNNRFSCEILAFRSYLCVTSSADNFDELEIVEIEAALNRRILSHFHSQFSDARWSWTCILSILNIKSDLKTHLEF